MFINGSLTFLISVFHLLFFSFFLTSSSAFLLPRNILSPLILSIPLSEKRPFEAEDARLETPIDLPSEKV